TVESAGTMIEKSNDGKAAAYRSSRRSSLTRGASRARHHDPVGAPPVRSRYRRGLLFQDEGDDLEGSHQPPDLGLVGVVVGNAGLDPRDRRPGHGSELPAAPAVVVQGRLEGDQQQPAGGEERGDGVDNRFDLGAGGV